MFFHKKALHLNLPCHPIHQPSPAHLFHFSKPQSLGQFTASTVEKAGTPRADLTGGCFPSQNMAEAGHGRMALTSFWVKFYSWLVVWLPCFIFPLILGCYSSQLTFIFFRGVAQPPTSYSFSILLWWGSYFSIPIFAGMAQLIRSSMCAGGVRADGTINMRCLALVDEREMWEIWGFP